MDGTSLKVELPGVTWIRGPRGDGVKGGMKKRALQQMCSSDPKAEQRHPVTFMSFWLKV